MFNQSIYERYAASYVQPEKQNEPAWWFVFNTNKLLIKMTEGVPYIPQAVSLEELNIKPLRTQYLGTLDGQHCYCADVDDSMTIPEGMSFNDLRSLFGVLDQGIFLLAGRAFQILHWDRLSQYCGRCGTQNEMKQDERAKLCPKCHNILYPRISPAIIVAVIKDNQILLAHSSNLRGNLHSCIAGFVEPGETFEDCVNREVMEETGIKVKNLKYFGSQPWPFPDSLMVGFIAEYESGEIMVDGVEVSHADWYEPGNFPEAPSPNSIAGHLISWFVKNHS